MMTMTMMMVFFVSSLLWELTDINKEYSNICSFNWKAPKMLEFRYVEYGLFFKRNACNRPFPSCPLPQFQNESTCKAIEMKMTLICMKMDVKVKLIFI